jgi:hypothetical protein
MVSQCGGDVGKGYTFLEYIDSGSFAKIYMVRRNEDMMVNLIVYELF